MPSVLNDHLRPRIRRRNWETLLLEQRHVLLHSPFGFVKAILDRAPDTAEAFQLRRKEAEEVRVLCGFDGERVVQINHRDELFIPAALSIAWQVPVGTSLDP